MKIIKEGKIPIKDCITNSCITGVCDYCKCEFEAEPYEMRANIDFLDINKKEGFLSAYCFCPTCGNKVTLFCERITK